MNRLDHAHLPFRFLIMLWGVLFPVVMYSNSISDSIIVPKVAVVLSGGGAKGFTHIGVLKVLEEEGIPVDMIVGTSIGSLVGGIYAMGYSADEIEQIAKDQDWESLLSDDIPRIFLSENDRVLRQRYLFSLPFNGKKKPGLPQGLIRGQNVLNLFCGLAGNVPADADFSQLPIPFACVAADIKTGEEVVLRNGFLPTAMFSSMAIPAVFQSSMRDGRLLIDGGVVNNFPTDVAKKMGADIIIGVDFPNDDNAEFEKFKSIDNVVIQLINFFGKEKDSLNNSLCNVLIHPDTQGYTMASFTDEAVDTLILRGKKAADAFREQLRGLKAQYHLERKPVSREFVKPEKWEIRKIDISGNNKLDEEYLKKCLRMEIPGRYSYIEIKEAIDRLYGYGGFDKIYFNLIDGPKGKMLNLNVVPKNEASQNVGFRVNTTDAAALLLNFTSKSFGQKNRYFSVSTELSANPALGLMFETNKRDLPTLGIELKGKYQNYHVYENGEKRYNADIFYGSGSVYLYQSFLKRFDLGLGIQEEFFNGDVFSKDPNSYILPEKANKWMTNGLLYFSLDNLDNFYFPTKGTNLYGEFSLNYDWSSVDHINPVFLLRTRNVVPLKPKTALLLDFYGRAVFNDYLQPFKATLVGGDYYSHYFNYHFPFIGLPPVTLSDQFTYVGMAGLRFQVSNSQYLSLIFNTLQQSNKAFSVKASQAIYGGGIKYSLKSVIGPVDIGLGYSDVYDAPTFSANLGFWF